MREVLSDLHAWWSAGQSVGIGTVVGAFKSAPRPPGASMLVGPDGSAVGSVSGGCVEGAVFELATLARDGAQPMLQRYGVSDDEAFSVGLTCGGIIDLFIEKIDRSTFPEFGQLAASILADEPVALATVISGPPDKVGRHLVVWPSVGSGEDGSGEDGSGEGDSGEGDGVVGLTGEGGTDGGGTGDGGTGAAEHESEADPTGRDGVEGSLGSSRIDDAVRDDVRGLLAAGKTCILTYGTDGERRGEGLQVFVAAFAPAPRMIVFGAIDFAAAVARAGSFLGYRVTVCDARPVFATRKRFPEADEVIVDWPHRYLSAQVEQAAVDPRTVICVLTHDPKFDVPVLQVALKLPVAFVGAMGSRRTHLDRLERLREAGVTEEQLDRLSSPIGLDLGARTPEETAISIAAEIIAKRWNGDGRPLSALVGAIHREPVVDRSEPTVDRSEPTVDRSEPVVDRSEPVAGRS